MEPILVERRLFTYLFKRSYSIALTDSRVIQKMAGTRALSPRLVFSLPSGVVSVLVALSVQLHAVSVKLGLQEEWLVLH